MSRFDTDYEEGIPYGLWEGIVSNALGGKRTQEALAELESALTALPEPKLISGHLAAEGSVCTVGAFVAAKRAEAEGTDMATMVETMVAATPCECSHLKDKHDETGCHDQKRWFQELDSTECACTEYRPEYQAAHDTAEDGKRFGLLFPVAWHLAYLNDEQFADATPEQRYEKVLAWVRRAQGKEA